MADWKASCAIFTMCDTCTCMRSTEDYDEKNVNEQLSCWLPIGKITEQEQVYKIMENATFI